MKDEIRRINRLVAEGRLSPEDAADLIDAFYASERPEPEPTQESGPAEAAEPSATQEAPPAPSPSAVKETIRAFVDSVEKLTKERIEAADWQDVSRQVRENARRGLDALRAGLEDLGKGKVSFGWFSPQETKEVALPLTVPPGKTLRIENACGDVVVVGGFPVGTATARARFKAANIEEARERAEGYTLVVEESERHVCIRQPDVAGLSVDLDIQYGGPSPVEVRCEDGDVRIMDTKDSVRVSSRSGDVRLRGVGGSVEVSLSSGDVSVEDSSAQSVAIENRSGDIRLTRVSGDLNVRTASGDVSAVEVDGRVVSIESVSGDVSLSLRGAVVGSVSVRTMSGDARVAAPGGDCRVSLSALNGDVRCDASLDGEIRDENRVTGRLGSGVGSLDVSAVSGDVSLELRSAVQV